MATAKKTLLDLVTVELKKTDDQRSLEQVKDMVEENQNQFANDLFQAKKLAKAAAKVVEALESNVKASASDIITANRNLSLLEKNVSDIEEIIARRF